MKLRTDEFERRLADARAQWSADRAVVMRYGDPLQEYWAVRDGGLGLADRSSRETLVVSGEDAVTWLQGLVTNDVYALRREGSGQRSMAVNHVGRTLADLRILHMPDMLLIDLEPGGLSGGDFLEHLRRHIIMEEVTLEDRTAHTARLTLTGRLAPKLLADVARLAHPVSRLELYDGSWGELAGCDVVVQRVGLTGEPTYDLSCSREDAARVWDALLKQSHQLRPVGEDALELLRMEAGEVRFGVEYDTRVIPIEADLNDTISYTKGCYLGQEVIHRLDTRGRPARMLRALLPLEVSATLEAGMRLEQAQAEEEGGKTCGEVGWVSRSPQLDEVSFGLAYVKRGAYEEGTRLIARGSPDQPEVEVRVARLGEPLRLAR